jgi:hypothetical protein
MEDAVLFGGREYVLMLSMLIFARGMDFLSTWVATPNLELEGNPLAKKLGWKWAGLLNVGIAVLLARWPQLAIAVSTASVLVAARNFRSAWVMHTMGEAAYRDWHVQKVQETRISLFLFCLAGETLLTAALGAALIIWCTTDTGQIPLGAVGVGSGLIIYAGAVAFYTLLSVWRLHRAVKRDERRKAALSNPLPAEKAWN